MAAFKRLPSGRIKFRDESFAGFNKPKRTPNHASKSHAVAAKEGSKIKLIRFGEQGAKTAGKPKAGSQTECVKNVFPLKHVTVGILNEAKCQPLIGLTRLSGDALRPHLK